MRKTDRAFRPDDGRVPAPGWVWALVLALIGAVGMVAALLIITQ